MKRLLAALLAGAVFGVGLALSRMTDPNVVLGFLDVFGDFDPSLAFVLVGAVLTSGIAFGFILRRERPLLSPAFKLPVKRSADPRLIAGAIVFGIGWGLAGYCPGPVLVGAAAGVSTALWFVPVMLLGSWLQKLTAGPRSE
jgi:uncharacterized protein